jgi:hypothetical protein
LNCATHFIHLHSKTLVRAMTDIKTENSLKNMYLKIYMKINNFYNCLAQIVNIYCMNVAIWKVR